MIIEVPDYRQWQQRCSLTRTYRLHARLRRCWICNGWTQCCLQLINGQQRQLPSLKIQHASFVFFIFYFFIFLMYWLCGFGSVIGNRCSSCTVWPSIFSGLCSHASSVSSVYLFYWRNVNLHLLHCIFQLVNRTQWVGGREDEWTKPELVTAVWHIQTNECIQL